MDSFVSGFTGTFVAGLQVVCRQSVGGLAGVLWAVMLDVLQAV